MAIKFYFPASDIRGVLPGYAALIRDNGLDCETLIRITLLMFCSGHVRVGKDGWNS